MKLYGIKTCDTCRKALKSLTEAGNTVEFVDVRATPLPTERIAQIYAEFGSDLVNTRSATWRAMDDLARALPAVEQLCEQPTLMKRPVIESDGALFLGWSKEVQEALL